MQVVSFKTPKGPKVAIYSKKSYFSEKNHTLFIPTFDQKYEIHTKTEKSYQSGKRAFTIWRELILLPPQYSNQRQDVLELNIYWTQGQFLK